MKALPVAILLMLCNSLQADERSDLACDIFDEKLDAKLKVKISLSKELFKTNKLNFGFNIELGQIAGANGNYSSKMISQLVTKINPNALRYPGGTTANYFDWANEKLNEKYVLKYANQHINTLLKRLKKKNDGKVPSASLESYSTLVSRHNIQPFVVLNVFEPNKAVMKAIDKVKAAINKPIHWELGNEVAYRAYQKRIKLQSGLPWGKEVYLKKIIAISKYIKAKYPSDKIGVVASEMAELRNPKTTSTWRVESRRKVWDEVIASANHYFDAVIVHPYIFAGDNFISNVEIQCLNNSPEQKIKYRSWIMSNIANLPSLYLRRLGDRYPGKEIWMTEFGIMDPGGIEIDLKLQKQTGFRVLSSAANYVSWLSKYPNVTSLLTHGMFVGYDWTHAVFPDFSYTANGIAFKYIREYLDGIDMVAPVSFIGHQEIRGVDSFEDMTMQTIYSIAGYDKKTDTQSLLIINVANHEVDLMLPWRAYSMASKSFGWEEGIKPGDYTDLNGFDRKIIKQDKINIMPRSIVIVKSRHVQSETAESK